MSQRLWPSKCRESAKRMLGDGHGRQRPLPALVCVLACDGLSPFPH